MNAPANVATATFAPEPPPPAPRLVVTVPERSLVLDPGTTCLIGRDPDADLRLTGRTVSRAHARIECTDSGWRIVDLDSTNGLWHEGTRVISLTIDGPLTLHLGKATGGSHGVPLEIQAVGPSSCPVGSLRFLGRSMIVLMAAGETERWRYLMRSRLVVEGLVLEQRGQEMGPVPDECPGSSSRRQGRLHRSVIEFVRGSWTRRATWRPGRSSAHEEPHRSTNAT